MKRNGFPKAMIYAGAVLAAVLIAEAVFLLVNGTDKSLPASQVTELSVQGDE